MVSSKLISIGDMLRRLPEAFIPEKSEGMDRIVHLNLSGDAGGIWTINISNKQCSILDGLHGNANLVFSAGSQDCIDIFTGRKDALQVYMQGKLRLDGDMMLAMQLINLFDVKKLSQILGYQH